MSSTPDLSREQLAAARTERWHQHGDPLLTLDAVRDWIADLGLVLFAPRAHQLAAPAPSLVEATLGHAEAAPSAAQSETARSLVARLTAEGTVLPLNLLGSPGDAPDFLVSTPAFSYVFTLRGDKLWKQPPVNAGAIKVSPLASGVYEKLAAGGALSAPELASELGREVTEAAILRSLVELWSQLRVLPLLQQDGSATLWELTSRRFTRALKQGANAGQPTALSALISLYLAQSLAATTDEIEIFLSPLTARSRVRDVLHGLTAGRQLESVVLEGKEHLFLPGALADLPAAAAKEPEAEGATAEAPASPERIRRFDRPRTPREGAPARSRDRQNREDRPARPARSAGPGRPARSGRPAGGDRGARPSRPSRPFADRDGARPFRKPPFRETPTRSFGSAEGDTERPFRKPRAESEGRGERTPRPKKPFGKAPFQRDSKPRFERRPAGREGSEERERRPFQRSGPGGSERTGGPARTERPNRPERSERSDRPARPSRPFRPGAPARPDRAGRPDRAARPDRPSRPARSESPSRPPRPGRPSFTRPWDENRPPRPRRDDEGSSERRSRDDNRPSRPSFAERDPRKSRPTGDRKPFGSKPKFGYKPSGFSKKREAGDTERPKRTFGRSSGAPGQNRSGQSGFKGSKPGFKSSGFKSFRAKPGAAGKSARPGKTGAPKKRKTDSEE